MSNREKSTDGGSAQDDSGTPRGLYDKYEVYKDGERQSGCFVLKPATDESARHALRAYAAWTDNEELAEDIREMVSRLDGLDETKRRFVDGE